MDPDALIDVGLRGVFTHGLVRFPIYVDRLRRGLVKARPRMRMVRSKCSTLDLDEVLAAGAEFAVPWPA